MLLKSLHRLYLACWYGGVILLIVLAVGLTAARALFPAVDRYRAEIEEWAGRQLGSPVSIMGIDARIDGITPTIVLRGATLRDRSGAALMRFEEALVGLDLFRSLTTREAVLKEFTLQGVRLELERLADGRMRLRGLEAAADASDNAGVPPMLFGDGRLLLRDVQVTLRDSRLPSPPPVFAAEQLELRNAGGVHRLEGRFRLSGAPGEGEIKVAADIEGDPVAGEFSGAAYLEGRGIAPGPWVSGLAPVSMEEGRCDFRVWADWKGGRLEGAVGTAAIHGMRLTGPGGELAADRLAASFESRRLEAGWGVRVADLVLEGRGHALGPLRAELETAPERLELSLTEFPLGEAASLSRVVPGIEAEQRELLGALNAKGALRGIRLRLLGGQLADLRAELAGVSLRATGGIPGIEGLGGRLRWHEGRGELLVDGRNGQVDLATLMREPIPFDHLTGRILASRDSGGLVLEAPELQVANADVRAQATVGFELPASGSSKLAIAGRFQEAQATAVRRYLPAKIMPPKTVAWLESAFRGGRVPQGYVLFYGAPADFPFDRDQGRFEVGFVAEKVALHYQEGWPLLTEVAGDVLFRNRSMLIHGRDGRLFGGRVESTRVAIANLDNATITIDGRAHLKDNDPLRLLTETPLKSRFAAYTYPKLRLQGEAELDLNLTIPLESSDPSPLKVTGALELKGGSIALTDRLTVEKATGQLLFDESRVYSERPLGGSLLGGAVEVRVLHEGEGDATQTRIAASGTVAAAALRRLADHPLLQQLAGQSAWRANLTVPHARAGGAADPGVRLQVASNLLGLASPLPPPLAKEATEPRELELSVQLSGSRKGHLTLGYGQELGALLDLSDEQGLARGAVRFGGMPSRLPEGRELLIQGSLLDVDAAAWSELLKPVQAQPPATRPSRVEPVAVTVEMERLQLRSKPESKGEPDPADEQDPPKRTGPPRRMRVHIRQLVQGDSALGELTYAAEPRAGVSVEQISLAGAAFTLNGRGMVLYDATGARTEMAVDLASDDVGRMMKALGFASVISNGKLRSQGNLTWPGELGDFALARLGGGFHVSIQDGRMDELQPGAGRLLGLFSLQALPSRLSLDFRDLFESGFRFKLIDGDFKLTRGDAETSNLRTEANAADIQLTGRTGLHRRDYDQTVSVTPHVAGSLPVAGGLAWGPHVGAALLLVQTIFQPQIDAAATFRYRVTGSWEQPVVERIGQPAAPAPAAVPSTNQ